MGQGMSRMSDKIKNALEWVCIIWTISTIAWWILSLLNIMPYYGVKIYPVNTVNPIISLFPGQPIRLDFDSNSPISRSDINSAHWLLLKGQKILFTEEGLEPTVTLPTRDGGSYQLKVTLNMSDNSFLTGKTNFYVVQDIPKQITLSAPINIEITAENSTPSLIRKAQATGVEISSSGQWTKVPIISSSPNKVVIGIPQNETIDTYNDKVLLRASGYSNELNSYMAAPVPLCTAKPGSTPLNDKNKVKLQRID